MADHHAEGKERKPCQKRSAGISEKQGDTAHSDKSGDSD